MSNEQKINFVLALTVAVFLAVFAAVVVRIFDLPFGIMVGGLIGVAVARLTEPNRTITVWIITIVMVIVIIGVRIANDVTYVSTSFYWEMLGLAIGWIQSLAMSWEHD